MSNGPMKIHILIFSISFLFLVTSAFTTYLFIKKSTVSAPIDRWRFIKISGFYGGGLLKFFRVLPEKSLKKCSCGFIKSGVL